MADGSYLDLGLKKKKDCSYFRRACPTPGRSFTRFTCARAARPFIGVRQQHEILYFQKARAPYTGRCREAEQISGTCIFTFASSSCTVRNYAFRKRMGNLPLLIYMGVLMTQLCDMGFGPCRDMVMSPASHAIPCRTCVMESQTPNRPWRTWS